MTVALVMTVRDEARLLRANLLYHRHAGVEVAFVYSDRSTDGTLETVAALPFVHAGPALGAERVAGRAALARAAAHVGTHTTARQLVNTCDAMDRARAAGCTWLVSLDADELACADLAGGAPGALAALLAGMPPGVQCVRLPTLEVVQRGRAYDNVFAEETLFKRQAAAIRRRIRDPLRGGAVTARGFYGHTEGKSAVRLSAGAVPRTPHRFVGADGAALPTAVAGHLLHYYCPDFESFVAKFRRFSDHPDVHLWNQPVDPLKRLWRDVVNAPALTEADLRAYYDACVAFDDRAVRRLARSRRLGVLPRRPALVEVTGPQRAFAALAAAPADAAAPGRAGAAAR